MGALNPLEIFPLEVWETIFEQLGYQGSGDLLSCSRVCTKFQNVLKPTQSQWLFELICPLIFPYLKGGELLTCRRVCKKWCLVVTKFLEDFETRRPFNKTFDVSHSTEYDPLCSRGIKWTHFFLKKEIVKFMKVMKPGKNPFVGGSLSLNDLQSQFSQPDSDKSEDDESPNVKKDFWGKASDLVSMFGVHVKDLMLEPGYMERAETIYLGLQQNLLFLPNLRSLIIKGDYDFFLDGPASAENHARLNSLVEYLEQNSMPKVPTLESLKLDVESFPMAICEKLISEFSNLKCLKLNLLPHSFEESSMIRIPPLPSLTELHLSNIKSSEHLLHLLDNIGEAPLLKLKIVLNVDNPVERMNVFDTTCESINRFVYLQVLSVRGYVTPNMGVGLSIPSLRKLETRHVRNLEIDELTFGPGVLPSHLESLEYVHLTYAESLRTAGYADLGTEFYKSAFIGEVAHSPIWTEMPKLKIVRASPPYGHLSSYICTREMHEYYAVRGVPF